jgi:uncharacterized delta-60 repeat protein
MLVVASANAQQITLSNTNDFRESFDSMGAVTNAALPNGLKMTAAGQGTSAGWDTVANLTNVNLQASSGSPTTGGRYNWGSSATDRAAGFMTSGGYASPNAVIAKIVNDTGSIMTGLNISFDVERYRVNTAAANVTFFTSSNGTDWTSAADGDTGAFATNTSSYTFTNGTVVSKALSLLGLSVSNGGAIYLKWNFNTTGGNSQGLGLDNLVLRAVVPSANAPVITSASTASVVGFTAFSYEITATQSPTSFGASGLPAGLTVDTSTGLISGTPTEQGTFNATISASNASGTGSAPLTLTVSKNPGAPTITSALTASGELNIPFSYQITASNSPTSYSASNLHTGLTIDTATGLISGTPFIAGSRNVTITASNALGTDTQTLVLFIGAVPVITPPTTASAYTSASVTWQVTATGPATSFTATGLPAGLSINTSTGLISGTAPATTGNSAFQVTALNALGTATQTFNLAVFDQTLQNAIPLNVVVNKYANSTPDLIQLLVVGNGTPGSLVDMRGMIIKDFSSSMGGDGGGKYSFAENLLWAAVPSGTLVALSTGNTAAEDLDPADFYIAVNLDNTTYFTNVGGPGAAMDIATTEMVMIKAAGTGALGVAGGIHCFGSGAAGTQFNAFLGGKLLGTGTTGAGLGTFANNATSALADYGTSGSAAATGATGNTAVASLNFASWNNASNQTYVLSLRGSSTTPTILVTPSSITTLAAVSGSAGTGLPFQVSGSNLTGNLTVSAPANLEVSTTSATTGFATTATITASGALAATDVWVRIASTAATGPIGPVNVQVTGGGATSQNVAVSGTVASGGSPAILANPTSLGTLVAYTGQPGTAQSVAVTGQSLPGQISLACDSNEYEVANAADGNFGVAATLPAGGGTVLVRLKAGSTAGAVASTTMVLESGTGAAKVSTSVPIAGGTRISGGTGGLEPALQTFASDLNFTATARFTWVLKGNTVDGRGTNFSGVNVGGNLGVAAGAAFDLVFNGASSTTDFANPFWQSARSWLVFNVTGNTTGSFTLGAIAPDSGGKYYAGYGSFGLRTDAGGDVYLDWTPGSAPTGPVISVGATSLNLPGTTTNVAGSSANFTVSGASLTGNITVTALDAVNFAVSTNSSSGFASSLVLTQTAGAVSSIPVYVRLTGSSVGTFTNTVTAASAGATTRTVTVAGTVTNQNAPAISVSTNALGGFTTLRGTPSAPSNLTVTGTNLSGSNIAVTSSNNFYEISTDSFATAGSNTLTLASTGGVVAVRISTNAPATNILVGNLALSGGGVTNDVALSGVVTNPPAVITVSTNSLPAFSSTTNVASAAQSFTAGGSALTTNITVAAPTGFQVAFTSNNADFGTAVTLTNSGGTATNREVFVRMSSSPTTNNLTARNVTLTTTGGSNQVSVSGTITDAAPSLAASPSSLTNFFAVAGTASAATNYVLSGSNLTTSVTVSAPTGFQVALTNTNAAFTNTLSITNNGSISNNIWVRASANAATNTNLTGNITNIAGAAVTNVALQAMVVPAPTITAVPTALSNFSTITGIASTNQSFNLTASNLLGPVAMTVTNGYEISLNPSNGFSTSLSVGLVSASDNASNYVIPGRTNTAIAYVGSESGSAVTNWSDSNVAKTYGTGGSQVYGTAGYYQIRPVTPTNSADFISTAAAVSNNLAISATNYPTAAIAPLFVSSIAGSAGTFVNFPGYPNFRATNGSDFVRQGALSVSVNQGPFTTPAGTNASYFGVPLQFTVGSPGSFRIGLVVDAVADSRYAPDYVSLFSSSTGTVYSASLVRDGNPDMVFFDVTAKAGDTFNVGLWQNTGTQFVAALSMVTFDNLPSWTNGANGGTGFGAWQLPGSAGTGGFNGAYIGAATNSGVPIANYAPLYTGGVAFSIYAGGAGDAYQDAMRPFAAPMVAGQTLTHSLAITFDNGNKGFSLLNGTNEVFYFNVNSSGYTWSGGGSNGPTPYPGVRENGVLINFSITRTPTGFNYTFNSAQDSNLSRSGSIVADGVSALKYYISGAGGGDAGNLFFNSPQIAFAGGDISNLPVFVRLSTNAPVAEDPNSLLSRVSIATPGVASSASSASLPVVNGDFQNLTGLTTNAVTGWYDGVPSGWIGVSNVFTVRTNGPSDYVANLNTLSSVGPTFSPLYQRIGTNGVAGSIALNFDVLQLNANPISLGTAIYNAPVGGSPSDTNWVLLTNATFTSIGPKSLQFSNVAMGTPLAIAFWASGGTAPGIDNVSVAASGNPGTFVDLSGNVLDLPVITAPTNALSFEAVQGFTSDPQQFEVGGINLLTNVLVTPPSGYQVSLDGAEWAQATNVPYLPRTNLVTPPTPVFVRVAASAPPGASSGEIVLSSERATNVLIPVSRVVGGNTGPQLTANPASLPAFATDLGTASVSNGFVLTGSELSNSVALTVPSGFEISADGATFASNAVLLPRASGYLSNNIAVRLAGSSTGFFGGNVAATSGGTNASVAVTGTVYIDSTAQIAASPLALSNFATTNGTPSASQAFLASARNLGSTDLVATASGGYEISTNNADFFATVNVAPAGGNVGPVAFHARISSNAAPTNSLIGKVALSTGSAPPVEVMLEGEVAQPRPLSVVLTAPTGNPTTVAPGSTVRLSAIVSDTNSSGQPVQVAAFEFRTNNVAIPGASVTNVVAPYTLTYDWAPLPAGLPADVSAWAVDLEGWEGSSAAVTVRNPDPGQPVVGFIPPTAFPTNSQIEAVSAAGGGAFYIGGGFTNFVRTNGSIVVTNAATRVTRLLADGSVDPEFVTETGPNNTVRTLLYSPTNQGLYIGGAFTNVSGVARPGIARLAVGQTNVDDGTLDPNFAPALGGVSAPVVNSIVQQYDGKILVGGIFTTAGSGTNATSSANLARFLTNGARDVSFNPPSPNGEVKSVALQPDGKVLIAGSFAQVAGQERKGLARLNADGTLDTTFNVGSGPNGGFNGPVWSVAVALDGFVYAGGQFSSYNGKSVYNNLAKLSSTGVLETRFNYAGTLAGGINNLVRNVQTRPRGGILVSGQFTQVANSALFPTPVAVGRVAEFRPGGTLDSAFNTGGVGANNSVLNAATLANGNLVLVGAFTKYNGQPSPRIAVLAGATATNPVVTSPPFLTVDAGSNFDFTFTSSGSVPYDSIYDELPRGVSFDAVAGKLSGIPLDAGAFDMDVSATSPEGGFGEPSLFRLQVLPKIVPYDTWKQVWFTEAEQTNSAVSGPSVVGGNPSGQPNFTVYALSGGSPKEEGPWILPEAWPEFIEGQRYLTYTVWQYPLAAARYTVQVTGDLKTWETNTIAITNGSDFFQVRPPTPMSLTNRQFLRLRVSEP